VSEVKSWSALDLNSEHSVCRSNEPGVQQSSAEVSKTVQTSEDHIIIKDSCDVTVTTTDTQASVNLQAAIQLAIALILSISIADGQQADKISQDLFQKIKTRQSVNQKTYIENSRGISVSTTDTEASVNIQVLLQVLLALVAKLDVL
jgi:spore coat protein X